MSNNVPFTVQDLTDAIAFADDSIDSSVIVTKDGCIKVVSLDEAQAHPKNYAVRHETFDAGNDYLGYDASQDKEHIDTTFTNLVKAWNKHVRTGWDSIYADGFE